MRTAKQPIGGHPSRPPADRLDEACGPVILQPSTSASEVAALRQQVEELTRQVEELTVYGRSNNSKQRAVLATLKAPETRGLSDREIARMCFVSHTMVSKYREAVRAHENRILAKLSKVAPDLYRRAISNDLDLETAQELLMARQHLETKTRKTFYAHARVPAQEISAAPALKKIPGGRLTA